MNKTQIEWTDFTSNPLRAINKATGKSGHFCEMVSQGCRHCYASSLQMRYGTGLPFVPRNREKVELYLNERELAEWGKPKYRGKRVFAFDMTDLFGEWVSDEWLAACFQAMADAPGVTFQILTKRPERMRQFLDAKEGLGCVAEATGYRYPLPNVWLGVTVEDQRWCWPRVAALIDTPAAVRFVSAEPLLGPISFAGMLGRKYMRAGGPEPRYGGMGMSFEGLDWMIVGGESGPKHRRFDPDWARSIRDQCAEAGVAFFMKQLGSGGPPYDRKCGKVENLPPDLRIREFPR